MTTDTAILSSTVTTITVPSTVSTTFPTTYPFKVMVGTVSSGAFTGSPEVISVTAASASANGTLKWTVSRPEDGTSALSGTTTTPNISSNLTASTTSLTVSSTTGFPTTSLPFKIMVGSVSSSVFTTPEIMTVTAVGGSSSKTWTVTRGVDGTTPLTGTSSTINAMTVALVQTLGLYTAPPLYGTYTAASTQVSATVGTTPSTASLWTSWTASTLGTYLTGNVYAPASSSLLTTSNAIYQQLLRLYTRSGGTGIPKNSAGTYMPCDWRSRFFTYSSSGSPVMDNDSTLFSSGVMNAPSSSGYSINYAAILDWIQNCGPNPFPAQLRSGGIVYYTSIPTTINTANFPCTDPNQRFWKEYIDSVLGFQQTSGTGTSAVYSKINNENGYGDDIGWGTTSTSGQPSGWPTSTYMTYSDNPDRPLLRHWFGGMTMVDYLGNYNASDPGNYSEARLWWPGTVAECPTYQTKLGVQAALVDIFQNHPNDNVSLVFFSTPKTASNTYGYYQFTPSPMGRNQIQMINSLWFAPYTVSTGNEFNLYNSSGTNTGYIYTVPRANGGTCYDMALMLAYNQFSANSSLVNYTANATAGTAGGNGRNGSTKLLIFETDGVVNTAASATLVSSTTGQGYYKVLLEDANNYGASGSQYPSTSSPSFSTLATDDQSLCTKMCSTLANGGYATSGKPVLINCIAFGSLFDPSNSSTTSTNALSNLAAMEVIGSVQPSGATTLASSKIIYGSFNTRISNLQTAFTTIVEDGIQLTLVSSGTNLP